MASSANPIDLTSERDLEPALLNAITLAKDTTLRRILIEVCMKSEVCTSHIRDAMLVPRELLKSTSINDSTTAVTKKRKLETTVARFVHCAQCKKDFDVVLNEKSGQEQACARHEGTVTRYF